MNWSRFSNPLRERQDPERLAEIEAERGDQKRKIAAEDFAVKTAKPQRIQLSRKKGFNLQAASLALNGLSAVNCARPSRWGNPFPVNRERNVFQAVREFKAWLKSNDSTISFAEIKRDLHDKNLACWCKASPCHADVLLEIANS